MFISQGFGNHKLSNISLKITLHVLFVILFSLSKIKFFNPSLLLTLDNATYNWPCVKMGSIKNNPTFESDWHWLLFMVIAKHIASGNCRRWKVNDILLSEGVNDILGINVRVPILLPDMISASTTRFPNAKTNNLVPLHKPPFWSIFLSNIIGTQTFNTNLWSGKPGGLRPLRTSGEYTLSSKSLWRKSEWHNLSELNYSFLSPGNNDSNRSLISCTISFFGVNIALLGRNLDSLHFQQ